MTRKKQFLETGQQFFAVMERTLDGRIMYRIMSEIYKMRGKWRKSIKNTLLHSESYKKDPRNHAKI